MNKQNVLEMLNNLVSKTLMETLDIEFIDVILKDYNFYTQNM